MKEQYAIHEVAALLGISADAIRLYEKEGLVHPTRNPGNGYRYYNFQEIQRVMGISLYRQLGIGINKIRQLVQQQSFDEVEGQFDRLIEENERDSGAAHQSGKNEIYETASDESACGS